MPQKNAASAAKLSMVSNTCLTLGKLITGLLIGSISIISEAAHSLVDLIAAFIAFAAIKESAKPADNEHPYGHGKFENISGSVEALLIFAAAVYIIYEAVSRLISPNPVRMPLVGALVMFVSAAVNFFVSQRLFKIAKETDSIALEADGWHLRADVWTSVGVMSALLIITLLKLLKVGGNFAWIDPAAALVVALMIIKTAVKLTVKSVRDLFDVSLPDEEVAEIENIIRAQAHIISGCHDLKTRKAGNKRFVEFHILVNPKMTVLQSHEITRELEKQISLKLENSTITIHVEPCDYTCTPKCRTGCLVKIIDN
ncbi:cation diffusion facilitator family transporter [Endomicrobium proavitum]|uniref:Putative cation efflux family protein, CzcD-like n=1 Tax=Endomicrobium proavitum TaxID=1408281 RepID=A0A0G3WIB6_9BACT|nr:cation diffusion facilitator family transporter [Endomicrobium proavitum]AKL97612.1 putative cation efflux family protein, CzcD-like [Endomicrobium proavitum]